MREALQHHCPHMVAFRRLPILQCREHVLVKLHSVSCCALALRLGWRRASGPRLWQARLKHAGGEYRRDRFSVCHLLISVLGWLAPPSLGEAGAGINTHPVSAPATGCA